MVITHKLSAIAVLSLVAASGAAGSLNTSQSTSQVNSHRGRQLQQPGFVKVQKRSSHVADTELERRQVVGGIIGGIGSAIGGIVGESPTTTSSPAASTPNSSTRTSTRGSNASSRTPAPSQGSSNNSGGSSGGNSNTGSNNGGSSSGGSNSTGGSNSGGSNSNGGSNSGGSNNSSGSMAGSGSNNNNSNNGDSGNTGNTANTGAASASPAANAGNTGGGAASNTAAAPTAASSPAANNAAAAAASSSAVAASLSAAAAASTGSATLLTSTGLTSSGTASITDVTTQTLPDGSVVTPSPSSTSGTNGSPSQGSSLSSGGPSKAVQIAVPIVVVLAILALGVIAFFLWRRYKRSRDNDFDPAMLPADFGSRSFDRGLEGLGGAAFAVGGAADGYAQNRRQRSDSIDSFEAGRPMSTLVEENEEYDEMPPPMTQIPSAPPLPVGGAAVSFAPEFMGSTGRLRNYGPNRSGSQRGRYLGPDDSQDHPRDVSASEDEYGAYDVNYYDGSSSSAYYNSGDLGMDAAGSQYSPFDDVQRTESLRSDSVSGYQGYSSSRY